jgi:exodeoxyribonuclease VII small subunit
MNDAEMKTIEKLTFEKAFAELEETVHKLEGGGLTLEESLALYERGQALAARCNAQLDQAELKVQKLSPEGVVPFSLEE